jgi:hypothetical protein
MADLGPGDWSLDALLGSERRGAAWAVAAFGAAAVGSTVAIELGKRHPVPASPEEAGDESAVASHTSAET